MWAWSVPSRACSVTRLHNSSICSECSGFSIGDGTVILTYRCDLSTDGIGIGCCFTSPVMPEELARALGGG